VYKAGLNYVFCEAFEQKCGFNCLEQIFLKVGHAELIDIDSVTCNVIF
jgi:hypothetical protein